MWLFEMDGLGDIPSPVENPILLFKGVRGIIESIEVL